MRYLGAARLDEGKFQQSGSVTSAVAALTVESPAVPAGKIWTVLAVSYYPSVGEARVLHFNIQKNGVWLSATIPASVALTLESLVGFVDPPTPMILFPGDKFRVKREAATAGSTMIMQYAYIESDMPPMAYIEPQREIARRRRSGIYPPGSPIGAARAAVGGHESEGIVPSGAPETGPSEPTV